eukprot:TRINITY_DN8731_c0_g1_i3.p1 TRINITY_DN8731_c0_g1~~TRINITY_DN8731_c0_g1_i3.p1  ORF type:complete len:322 (-),score=42.79 TRINITY_DN8731_c0_g1_i3:96-1061(-)
MELNTIPNKKSGDIKFQEHTENLLKLKGEKNLLAKGSSMPIANLSKSSYSKSMSRTLKSPSKKIPAKVATSNRTESRNVLNKSSLSLKPKTASKSPHKDWKVELKDTRLNIKSTLKQDSKGIPSNDEPKEMTSQNIPVTNKIKAAQKIPEAKEQPSKSISYESPETAIKKSSLPNDKTPVNKSTSPVKKKVSTANNKSEPKKKKILDYLTAVEEPLEEPKGNYFEYDMEELVIKNMQSKLNSLVEAVSSFKTENQELIDRIFSLSEKNSELKNQNNKLKERVEQLIKEAKSSSTEVLSPTFKFIKPHPGCVVFNKICFDFT